MKKIKLILLVVFFLVCVSAILLILLGAPVVIDLSKKEVKSNEGVYKKGDIIKPLDNLNFDEGSWTMYLIIRDSDLPKELSGGNSLKISDKEILKQMQSEWKFIYTNADIATVENEIIICKDNKVAFKSGIVLSGGKVGLQNREYGWLEAWPENILIKYLKQFRRNYSPIIILK